MSTVQVFQEDHKNLTKSPSCFDVYQLNDKSTGKFCQIYVVFLENLNFTNIVDRNSSPIIITVLIVTSFFVRILVPPSLFESLKFTLIQ